MLRGDISIGGKAHTFVPVRLVLFHVILKILGPYSVTTFNTPLRFWMKGGGLNYLYFRKFACVFEHFTNKITQFSVYTILGVPYFIITCESKALATVSASCWLIGVATTYLLKSP
jgi:hypothetical protein